MRRHLKSCVMGFSCLPILTLPVFAAGALPSNGNFVSGSGHISTNAAATQLTINQTTKNGIINWGGFSIGPGNGVQINNGNGATLNRVIGNSLSQIDGSLTATGSVYLINQNGIVVTPTGQVVTGGDFVASTRDAANPGFGSGAVHLGGNSGAPVTNQGTISAGGNAVLVGYSPINSGTINAPNGVAALVAGDDVTVQPGPGGLQIKVNAGSGNVTNSGTIAAAQAMLDAVGGNVYALAGNNNVISATGIANINGHVWLKAGGSVDIEAPVNSSGAVTVNAGGAGYSAVESNGGADGVYINNVISAGGPISIIGSGGNAGGQENYGVMIDVSGAVLSTGGAPITISGTGGGAGGDTFGNDGVFITGAVAGSSGPVSITGTGGGSSGPNNFGVTNEGLISNTGSGNITLFGTTGANGCGLGCSTIGFGEIGIANLGLIQAGTGNISLTGIVAPTVTGYGNFGIGIGAGALLTGGDGNISLSGTSNGPGGFNAGIFIVDVGYGAPVLATDNGRISITGTNNSNDAFGGDSGVTIQNAAIATGGDVTVTGNAGDPGDSLAPNAAVNIGGVGPADPASITAGGKIRVKSQEGDIVLNSGASLTADGKGAALKVRVEHGAFSNNADSSALNTPNGFSQIHSGN